MITSINPREIEHFSRDAGRWWDENGPFRPLHRLNPARLEYICGQIRQHYGLDANDLNPFAGLEILDIGCGGGLVCEPLARLGGQVTGIDADEQAVKVAGEHAGKAGLHISYYKASSEELLADTPPVPLRSGRVFDVVLALEIAEHVNNVDSFVRDCVNLCKPGGIIVFSTLNRTAKSFALGIVAAEYILRWVPRGTHQWKKFLRPSEMARAIRQAGATVKDVKGLSFNTITGEFKVTGKDISVNYFITAEKQ